MLNKTKFLPQLPKCKIQIPVLKNIKGKKIFTCTYCGEERGIEEFGRRVCPMALNQPYNIKNICQIK